MDGSMVLPLSSLRKFIGKRILRISRVLFSRPGSLEPAEDGPLEIEIDGEVLLFDGAPDGESLRLRAGFWEDPFKGSLSMENAQYIKDHGQWRRFDCSNEAYFSDLVGQELADVRPLMNTWGRIGGIRLSVDARSLWLVVECDECHVDWVHPIGFTESVLVHPEPDSGLARK